MTAWWAIPMGGQAPVAGFDYERGGEMEKVLRAVGRRPTTKAQVAAKLGVSQSYANRAVNELVREGLVRFEGYARKPKGRKGLPAARYVRVA